MIEVRMYKSPVNQPCCGCNGKIRKDVPIFELRNIGGAMKTDIILCEDCGNDLQNDIRDEYSRFEWTKE